jgi:hypothetical protein
MYPSKVWNAKLEAASFLPSKNLYRQCVLANPGSVGSTICVSGGFSIPIKRILELQTESKGHSDILRRKLASWRYPHHYH